MAIGNAVVYFARAAHAFSAGIKYRYCRMVKMCETMSRIICHASLLKKDDFRLKGSTMSHKTCIMCDRYCIGDIIHIISQCPYYHKERTEMNNEIYKKCPKAKDVFERNSENTIFYLLGRDIPFLMRKKCSPYGVYQAI